MFNRAIVALAGSLLAQTLPTLAALSPVTTVGSKFFTQDGNQFFIKGSYAQLLLPIRRSHQLIIDR